jgi:hypothetical protein
MPSQSTTLADGPEPWFSCRSSAGARRAMTATRQSLPLCDSRLGLIHLFGAASPRLHRRLNAQRPVK